MTRPLTTILAALLALAVTGVVACGGDDEDGGDSAATGTAPATTAEREPSEEPVATITVRETEFELNPATPTLDEAGTVRIEARNAGEVVHALTVETPSGEAETSQIQPGESDTLLAELTEPGEYTWYCPVGNHRELGMEGTITVGGGGEGDGANVRPKGSDAGRSSGGEADAEGTGPEQVSPEEKQRLREEIRERSGGY